LVENNGKYDFRPIHLIMQKKRSLNPYIVTLINIKKYFDLLKNIVSLYPHLRQD
jgi:hypothetical protein